MLAAQVKPQTGSARKSEMFGELGSPGIGLPAGSFC